jgi:hypothetical protein
VDDWLTPGVDSVAPGAQHNPLLPPLFRSALLIEYVQLGGIAVGARDRLRAA